jgi:YbbR domain-containing protein
MRDFFFKDFGWKLFSLLLAAFIWYTVHKIIEEPTPAGPANAISSVIYGELPVLIVATAADMHLYRVHPDKVSVTVSGPADVMSVLQGNQIRVTVDLSKFDAATDTTQPVDVAVPGGVTLVKVSPVKVTVIVPVKP